MINLMIEEVSNGWIVRPFEPNDYVKRGPDSTTVYATVEALQAALPKLLQPQTQKRIDEPKQGIGKVIMRMPASQDSAPGVAGAD